MQEEKEKDPKANIFTDFNKGFVAIFKMHADPAVEYPKAFGPLDKLTTCINTPLPRSKGTFISLV